MLNIFYLQERENLMTPNPQPQTPNPGKSGLDLSYQCENYRVVVSQWVVPMTFFGTILSLHSWPLQGRRNVKKYWWGLQCGPSKEIVIFQKDYYLPQRIIIFLKGLLSSSKDYYLPKTSLTVHTVCVVILVVEFQDREYKIM